MTLQVWENKYAINSSPPEQNGSNITSSPPEQNGSNITSSPPEQNGSNIADDIFSCIFVNGKFCILIKITLNFVPKVPIKHIMGLDNNIILCGKYFSINEQTSITIQLFCDVI